MKEIFSTPDTFLASSLSCLGHEIVSMKKIDGRVYFQFESIRDLNVKVQRYWNKTLLCDAQSLFLEHRTLKHRINNFR